MRVINWTTITSILLVLTTSVKLLGQPLSPTKWYRLRAHHVDIIFRGNIHREAQRIANTLEHLYEPNTQSLGTRPSRITIVLRNQSAQVNSFVRLSPRKAEFSSFPSPDHNLIGTNEWLDVLSVHEFRHVVQYACLTQNSNRLAYWLGGETLLGSMIFLNLPPWLLEGDAVGMETALTQSGRGRIPSFSLLYKTNLLVGRKFSYAKQTLGSFKDPVPDHYRVGYYVSTYLRRKYGAGVIEAILQKTTLPTLFSAAVKAVTHNTLSQIYEETNQTLKDYWQQQLEGLSLTQATSLHTRRTTDHTNYAYPQLDEQGDIVVLKSGIGTVAQFVKLDGKEHTQHLFTPGNIGERMGFSTAKNKIVWVETIPDVRWENRSYGVIKCYNTLTKRSKTLTHKSRYGTAALSPDATQIVAFESDEAYNHQLVILDAETGQILKRLPNPDNHLYLTPRWSADGRYIVVVKNVQRSVTIARIDITTGKTQDLLPYTTEHLSRPALFGEYVFYNSAYSGIDNIYAIDLTTQRRYQVTSSAYGAYNPTISADGYWLIFNDFTKDGMDAVKMRLEPTQWTPLEEVEDRTLRYYEPLVAQENNSTILENIPQDTYPVKRYHPWKHRLNVHSWLTLEGASWNTNSTKNRFASLRQVKLKLLQSKDLLDTTTFDITYWHNFKEKFGQASAKISYEGWYPIVSLRGGFTKGYENNPHRDNRYLDLSLKLPLEYVRGQYTHRLNLNTTGTLCKKKDDLFYTQEYQCLANRSAKKSPRDLYPPWGQQLKIAYCHTPQKRSYQEQYWCAQTEFYFPGLFKYHAICLHAKYAERREIYGEKWYRKQLKVCPPGTYRINNGARTRTPAVRMLYAFPLCYPDLSIGSLLYLKRLRATVDYCLQCIQKTDRKKEVSRPLTYRNKEDHLRLKSTEVTITSQYENTISFTLLADLHPFTLLNIPQLSGGVRYGYKLERQMGRLEFVFEMTPGKSVEQMR